jgi:predicted metal-dependent peptidase
MKTDTLFKIEISKDHKPAFVALQINSLIKEIKKITARKNVVVIVTEADK